jgi:hypothetical protein
MRNTNRKLPLACQAAGFEYNRLCFGLCNTPPTFQHLMDKVLGDLAGTEIYWYIDNLIIFSCTPRVHAVCLEHMLQRLEKENLKLQPDK